MTETYTKKDKDTLTVTTVSAETHIVEEDRAEIQTQLDHMELDAAQSVIDYQAKIDILKAKIAVLDK
jgi:hypothetical protein